MQITSPSPIRKGIDTAQVYGTLDIVANGVPVDLHAEVG